MEDIKVGSNTLESLTEGMYEDCRFIFREYIQNAADSIDYSIAQGILASDQAEIKISLNTQLRSISIFDNGFGVAKNRINELLDIGASSKSSKNSKGFRGIGRLGGIAYCEKLVFLTTTRGESKVQKISWDCQKMRKSFYSEGNIDIIEFIKSHVNIEEIAGNESDHFFEVTLENVNNSTLLDAESILEYCQFVLPVPYSKGFVYQSEVEEYANQLGIEFPASYNITLVSKDSTEEQEWDIEKKYKTYVKTGEGKTEDINGIIPFCFKHPISEEVIAWGWYAKRSKYENIKKSFNPERGLRLRHKNIQIGLSETLLKSWNESRFHWYFIGEIHCFHKDFFPNSRRDYFNENNLTLEFEKQLDTFFQDLSGLCRSAYYLNALRKKIDKKKQLEVEYLNKQEKGFWANQEQEERFRNEVNELADKIDVEKKDVRKKFDTANKTVRKALDSMLEIKDDSQVKFLDEPIDINYVTSSLSKLNKREQKVIERIVEIIDIVLDGHEVKDQLIERIKAEFK